MNSSKWSQLDLIGQLAHVASEITRARYWETRHDFISCTKSLEHVLELVNLILADSRWRKKRKELAQLHEVVCDQFTDQKSYDVSLLDLEKYCMVFALYHSAHSLKS